MPAEGESAYIVAKERACLVALGDVDTGSAVNTRNAIKIAHNLNVVVDILNPCGSPILTEDRNAKKLSLQLCRLRFVDVGVVGKSLPCSRSHEEQFQRTSYCWDHTWFRVGQGQPIESQ
jgi:hypothetical protein